MDFFSTTWLDVAHSGLWIVTVQASINQSSNQALSLSLFFPTVKLGSIFLNRKLQNDSFQGYNFTKWSAWDKSSPNASTLSLLTVKLPFVAKTTSWICVGAHFKAITKKVCCLYAYYFIMLQDISSRTS